MPRSNSWLDKKYAYLLTQPSNVPLHVVFHVATIFIGSISLCLVSTDNAIYIYHRISLNMIILFLILLQPKPHMLPLPRPMATWHRTCGRRRSSPSLPTRSTPTTWPRTTRAWPRHSPRKRKPIKIPMETSTQYSQFHYATWIK